jgi:hypothetical protein
MQLILEQLFVGTSGWADQVANGGCVGAARFLAVGKLPLLSLCATVCSLQVLCLVLPTPR